MVNEKEVIYSSVTDNGEAVSFKGKCGKYDFELDVKFETFPDEKARDKAYRVWVETYLDAVIRKRLERKIGSV